MWNINGDTVVSVFKVSPQAQGTYTKSLVNIYTLDNVHFEEQTIFMKKLFFKYKAQKLVIDGMGMGTGVLDYLVKAQTDDETGEYYPPFGIENDEKGEYNQYKTDDTILNAVYKIKATAQINTEMYAYVQSQMRMGKIKFLIDERVAKNNIMGTKLGKNMTVEQRKEYLIPFTLTSILKEELLNLHAEEQAVNIILKPTNSRIPHDKVSSFSYGLYYIHKYEERRKKRGNRGDLAKMMFVN